jgi:hypothetical protein
MPAPLTMDRSTFLRSAGGFLLAAIVGPASLVRPGAAHAHPVRADLEHPEPREGITSDNVLSVEALEKFSKKQKVMTNYEAARAHPEIFDGLACACSCGGKNGTHRSLLSCYETLQPTGCGGCQEEADIVVKMIKDSKSLAEIRVAVDKWAD